MENELERLRETIDEIDKELVEVFTKRMETSRRIGEYKREQGLPVFMPERERIVINRVRALAEPELAYYTQELYEKVIELCREYQE